uniref:Uncharacterized protein n=1 Tax=Arundo donax TaxID=35708 RepID=A0A0A9DNZ3_ARUDO
MCPGFRVTWDLYSFNLRLYLVHTYWIFFGSSFIVAFADSTTSLLLSFVGH